MTNNNNNNKKEDIQDEIENLLRNNASKSYSKEEIINLISSDTSTRNEIENILGEMEVWSSMKDTASLIYSSCKGGTVYFQWGQTP
jgi:hypothetical protein